MAKDTITATGKPSCACHCGEYKEVTKTYKNYCPRCGKSGTLNVSPKSTAGAEGEISCYPDGCGADYCINCGGDKTSSSSCSRSDWKLTPADGSNTTDPDSEDSDSGASTFGDMVLDLIKPLDGDVLAQQYQNKLKVCKIPEPRNYKLWAKEGVNIVDQSVTIHDYNPETTNVLYVKWSKGVIIVKNTKLIERFGEKEEIVTATKKVTTYKWVEDTTTTDTESTDSTDSTDTDTSSETDSSSTTS